MTAAAHAHHAPDATFDPALAAEAAPRTSDDGAALAELTSLIQSDGLSPEIAAMVARRHPHELDRLMAFLHGHGNVLVQDTLTLMGEPARGVALPAGGTHDDEAERPARTAEPAPLAGALDGAVDGEVAEVAEVEPDWAASRAWNRGHVRNVVRFDYATKHGYVDKRRNGELDVYRVADWQRAHQAEYPDLEVTGRVDELTCEIAEGRPPPPKKPKPKHAPSVEFLPTLELPHVPDGTAYPAGRIFHVPFELQAKPDTCVYVQGSITTLPDAQEMVNTDSEGHASGTIAFNAGNFSPNANQLTQLWQMTLIATENPFQGGRSGPVAIRMIRLVSAPKPLF